MLLYSCCSSYAIDVVVARVGGRVVVAAATGGSGVGRRCRAMILLAGRNNLAKQVGRKWRVDKSSWWRETRGVLQFSNSIDQILFPT